MNITEGAAICFKIEAFKLLTVRKRMFINVIQLVNVVTVGSVVFMNGIPNQRFSRRCARLDDTFKRDGEPIKGKSC